MAETFVVLGSNSFSGATFVATLLEAGHAVHGVSRSAEPDASFLPYRWSAPKGRFTFHRLNLNNDTAAVLELVERERAPYIVNFAAQSMVAQSWEHPEHWFQTNVVATVRLHEGLRRAASLKKYVHVTTPEVYGSTTGAVKEDAPFNPSTPYAVSRAAADMNLRAYFAAYKFPVVFTRAANVYGPGQQLYRIIPRTVLYVRLGRKLKLDGGGASTRSFVHGRDVADATLRVTLRGRPGEAYHISTERVLSIRALVEMICARMGASFADSVEVAGERLGKDAAYSLDSGKIRAELGWKDTVSLEQGIDETVAWVDRNLATLKSQPLDYVHKP